MSREPAKDEDAALFIVKWTVAVRDATRPVLCEYCGATRYSSPENIQAALEKGLIATCTDCYVRIDRKHGSVLGGRIRGGVVIEEQEEKNGRGKEK
jgi:hypothetical protein